MEATGIHFGDMLKIVSERNLQGNFGMELVLGSVMTD
jgi:hypothetical protein